MKKIIYGASIFLGMGLLMTSCYGSANSELEKKQKDLEKELNTVNYVESDNDTVVFNIKIPDYIIATSTLDLDRPFQYMNAVKEQYLVASYELVSDVQPSLEALKYEGKTKEAKGKSNHRLPLCVRLIAAVPKR